MSSSTPSSYASVRETVEALSAVALRHYEIDAGMVQEHANGERRITQGGYGDRQVYELVQNGADEMRGLPDGEIRVILTDDYLYCANAGNPMTPAGADTILRMGVSRKRGGQIGRFGVGVKSVLSVSDTPQFFSTGGSFGFDRAWAEQTIRAVVPGAVDIPILRMGKVLDTAGEAASDPILAELLGWAATVVRLPLLPGKAARLSLDLRGFPAEFQLFSPHVGSLILEDRSGPRPPLVRELFVRNDGNRFTLQSSATTGRDETSRWRVFTRTFHPSATAQQGAGELHDRPRIDVSWAVPEDKGRGERGTFWAFFPTNYATTLRGLLNAPWKTSEDRQNLYDNNPFNEELIEQAALLIVESLPELVDIADPGSYLTLLPGRGREAPQWADDRLTKEVWKTTAVRPSLPDQLGVLRIPDELSMPPENIPAPLMQLWVGYSGRPHDWTHPSIEQRERRARARLIFETAGLSEAPIVRWLQSLVHDGTAEASICAIRILAGLRRENSEHADAARRARIVLTESHGMVSVDHPGLYQRSGLDELADDLIYVDATVTDEIGLRSDLNELGVREATPMGKLKAVLDRGVDGYGDKDWQALWGLVGRVTPHDAADAIRKALPDPMRAIRVRTMAGRFRPLAECLLPGRVIPADGSRDQDLVVDLRVHGADRPALTALGMSDVPEMSVDPREDDWFEEYREFALKRLNDSLDKHVRLRKLSALEVDGTTPPGPLGVLTELSDEGKALFVKHLPAGRLVRDWTARAHSSTLHVPSPLVWMVRQHGKIDSSQGLLPVRMTVNPGLQEYDDVLPVASVDRDVADVLNLPSTVDRIQEPLWRYVVQTVEKSQDDVVPGKAYALVLRSGIEWPGGETRCRIGDTWGTRPDDQICVTADRVEYDTLVMERVPALLAPTVTDVENMVETWGMLRYADAVSMEIRTAEETEPVAVVTEFPHLAVLRSRLANGWSYVVCGELDEVKRTPAGMRTTPLESANRDRVVYVRHPADERRILQAVSKELDLRLSPAEVQKILDMREEAKNQDILKQVRATDSDIEKILLLVGAERLRRGLPEGLLAWEQAQRGAVVEDLRIAELALHAHGDAILRHHRGDLKLIDESLKLPFTGDTKSRQKVADLGFDDRYAGTKEETPPPLETAEGPTPHYPLHDYQEVLASRMLQLLMQKQPMRGMLSLPTGAGKTRVAAEAVIRYLKTFGADGPGRPILWIAQSTELCEQAVQSWKYVWEKSGLGGTRLSISRFWNSRDATQITGNPHLVVATDDQLTARLHQPAYQWLREPLLVIVDEAHGSTTKGYTALLEQMGITHHRLTRPLIGLTATPFRGKSTDETKRLIVRYGSNRLDDGALGENPYARLQDMGILARTDHAVLEGGELELTSQELHMMSMGRGTLPPNAERRLAEDHSRNRTLINALLGLDREWPVLVFATSVNHARFLAAVLNDQGVHSASVDSETPTKRRQQIIEQFGKGRLRVLTNYGVLHQGFDAPATRVVVVARPTYSPNVYQQMIGRGLRGPRNNGTERCLILNVRDNVINHQQQLAFTDFEQMWREA
ncbi:DEAD/DEAH box helicase [Micromonospora inositola]|uniref:Superfamily II DNA or RNA helicase n=1 Tax=Micromonospora inositola TaxID=47865 RepID=A0A1C5JH87_9ACTN|nr:DEAD/DEAH box helicase [Micromonospora inositola]SCG69954.1 Superfamily II DNA or RNA helicase [Micromonospora inositola]